MLLLRTGNDCVNSLRRRFPHPKRTWNLCFVASRALTGAGLGTSPPSASCVAARVVLSARSNHRSPCPLVFQRPGSDRHFTWTHANIAVP